jgi:hypothetical protein
MVHLASLPVYTANFSKDSAREIHPAGNPVSELTSDQD